MSLQWKIELIRNKKIQMMYQLEMFNKMYSWFHMDPKLIVHNSNSNENIHTDIAIKMQIIQDIPVQTKRALQDIGGETSELQSKHHIINK